MSAADTPYATTLRASSRGVFVTPWMIRELGIHAIFFAQLLWQMEAQQTDLIVRGDHEWEAETGLSRTQVLRAKTKLIEKGWLHCSVHKVRGTPTSHLSLVEDRLDADLRAVLCSTSSTPTSRDAVQTSTSQMLEEGESGDRAEGADQTDAAPPGPEELFKIFYEEIYPRRVGRGAALKSWRSAIRKAEPAVIIEGARRYAAAVKGKDVKFVAHPSTWLNGERWDDDPDAIAGSGSGGQRSPGAGHRRPIDTDRSGESGAVEF